jgi:hypothetical protein
MGLKYMKYTGLMGFPVYLVDAIIDQCSNTFYRYRIAIYSGRFILER